MVRFFYLQGKVVAMETYGMIMKKFYQKYMLVLSYYPPEWGLRQNINMSILLTFVSQIILMSFT